MELRKPTFRFDHGCKYFQEAGSNDEALPMFRYKEVYDSSVFAVDTFGDGSWIDTSIPSQCPPACACHQLAVSPEEESFAFTVTKSKSIFQVQIHSMRLRFEILEKFVSVKALKEAPIGDGFGAFDGFALVKCRPHLMQRLDRLRQRLKSSSQSAIDTRELRLVSEMYLLVNGLLNDTEITQPFHSRGPSRNLHPQQCYDSQQWGRFSNAYMDLPSQTNVPHEQSMWFGPLESDDTYGRPQYTPQDVHSCSVNSYEESYTVHNEQSFGSLSLWKVGDPENGNDDNHPDDRQDHSQSMLNNPPAIESQPSLTNVINNPRSESLRIAASRGDMEAVCQLLDAGADPNSTQLSPSSGPALYEAALAGHESIVRILINHGALVEGISIGSRTYHPLLAAIRRRSSKIVKLLLSHLSNANLNEVNLLDICPSQDRWVIARNLLDCGFTPESLTEQAVELSDPDERLISVLLDARADSKILENILFQRGHEKLVCAAKDQISRNRRLISAVQRGCQREYEQEIAAGANPSWALSTSLRSLQPDLAGYLLKQGADPRLLSFRGDLAGEVGKIRLSYMLAQSTHFNDKQLLDVLLDQGANVNGLNFENGKSILVEAIEAESYACVQHLLDRGALVNKQDWWGTIPLRAALQTGKSEIVVELLQHGASFDKNSDESTISSDCTDQGDPAYDGLYTHIALQSRYPKRSLWRHPSPREPHIRRTELYKGDPESPEVLVARSNLRNSVLSLNTGFRTPEEALFDATCKGQVALVQNMLECAADGNGCRNAIPSRVLSLDDSFGGRTCLMQAVESGHLKIAKALLQYGADVNIMSSHETALSIAAKSGIESFTRLLLQHGADLLIAALMLKIDLEWTARPRAIKWLDIMAKRFQEDILFQQLDTKREIALLHAEFLREHEHMRRTASFSGDTDMSRCADMSEDGKALDCTIRLEISKRWAYSLELNSRKAWAIGRVTLKRLCRRMLPQDLNQTLLFLALAKSMSRVLRSEGQDDCGEEFDQDVERWQILFKTTDQLAFQQAVESIWGINLAGSHPDLLIPSEQDLDPFQAMALHVLQQTERFHIGSESGDVGLMSVRASWKLRQGENLQPSDGTQTNSGSSPDPGNKESTSEIKCHETNDHVSDGSEDHAVPKETPNHCLLDHKDMVLAILMAGTIFTIVIGFFLAVGHSLFDTSRPRGDTPGNILLTVRQESLKIIAASVLVETLPHKESSDREWEGEVLPAVRKQTNEAIETGQINSSAKLAEFFVKEIEHRFTGLGKALAASCHRKRYFNVMQNAYSMLQAFLGLPITAISPSSLKQPTDESTDAKSRRKRAVSECSETERSPKAARMSPSTLNLPNFTPSSDDNSSTVLSSKSASANIHGKVTFCVECNRDFKTTSNYGKHRKGPLHDNKRYPCAYDCGRHFLRNDIRLRHEKKAHQGIMATKPQLPASFSS
ncbi:hypothetical protein PFICI_09018 [Pestalotiopsis fici W106-1]|uniref:C2H2-type domain-containing protein n=1 Tax=Pestalotiopsis fici (strain W106-1 / CGMCC3.15140) TaxID=1229662 RepID=W3WZ85_PESFW|nr:uncharacterized protein PFICI_09018 [Pestalotiopsis fici W106-1]ETS79165.1 hypothetical protein PFICI_09018 [Pestalotiopsis fici W106-1]